MKVVFSEFLSFWESQIEKLFIVNAAIIVQKCIGTTKTNKFTSILWPFWQMPYFCYGICFVMMKSSFNLVKIEPSFYILVDFRFGQTLSKCAPNFYFSSFSLKSYRISFPSKNSEAVNYWLHNRIIKKTQNTYSSKTMN